MDRRRFARQALGPVVTLLGLLVVELLTHGPARLPSPYSAALFLMVLGGVVVSAFLGGFRSALLATALYALYTPRFVAQPGQAVDLSQTGLLDVVVVLFIGLGVALPTAYLKHRDDLLHTRLLVSERERRAALETRNRELDAANRVLTDFSHVVSHDLKEPVRAMAAMHQLLEEDEGRRLSPEGRELLGRAREADARLALLLDALLEYSRASRLDKADLRPVDVGEVLTAEACRTRFADLARERGARILPPSIGAAPVLASPNAMSIILGNLVLNAIRHNPKPSPLVRVSVEPRPDGRVAVAVEDDGPGFSPRNLERIRAALEGRDPPEGIGRGGFGLLIVQRAVERLGGTLELGASPEGGASVRAVLPAPPLPVDGEEKGARGVGAASGSGPVPAEAAGRDGAHRARPAFSLAGSARPDAG